MIINDPHVEMIWILKWRLGHACIYELACWPSLMFRRLIQRMHPLLSAEARNAKTNDTQVVLFGGNEQAEPAALIHSVNCSFWNSTAFALHSSFCFVSQSIHKKEIRKTIKWSALQGSAPKRSLDFECQATWPSSQTLPDLLAALTSRTVCLYIYMYIWYM